MRFPDEYRDCVCFTTATRADGFVATASAFFVAVRFHTHEALAEDDIAVYTVTAKHVLGDRDGPADEVALWLNTHAGARKAVTTPISAWTFHSQADVAVLPYAPPRNEFRFRAFPDYAFATSDWRTEFAIGPGDDLAIVGLLVHHPGKTQNMPIVRLGSIAALPDDELVLNQGWETGSDVVGLAEVRSIGGHRRGGRTRRAGARQGAHREAASGAAACDARRVASARPLPRRHRPARGRGDCASVAGRRLRPAPHQRAPSPL